MAMDLPVSSLSSPMPMYDPRRAVNNILQHHQSVQQQQQPKPDSTVPSPPNNQQSHSDSTLADLASSEISLDLQGLIDDAHFGADAENLFGDLIDHQKQRDYVRLSPVNSLGIEIISLYSVFSMPISSATYNRRALWPTRTLC